MKNAFRKYGLLLVAFVLLAGLNYHPELLFGGNSPHWGWGFSLLATASLFFVMRWRDGDSWLKKLGIAFSSKDIWRFLIGTFVLLFLSYFVVKYVAAQSGYAFKPLLFHYKTYLSPNFPFHFVLGKYLYYIPQTFNEEMLVGAVLLMGLERNYKKLKQYYIAILVALVFSLMHQGMYCWSPVKSGETLTLITILSLFFVGILRNSLILKTRNIALSWAIHLSFNMIFFSGVFVNAQSDNSPSEPEVFNIVFGNWTMFITTGIFAILSLLWIHDGFNLLSGRRKN